MKKDIILPAIAGTAIEFNCKPIPMLGLRGEFFHSRDGIKMNYRQIRLCLDVTAQDDKLSTIMIRPDSPDGILSFDTDVLLSKDTGFVLHSLTAVDNCGNFLLKGTTPEGPFELSISTNPEGMNFAPMPGLLITEVRLPFEDNDWARS